MAQTSSIYNTPLSGNLGNQTYKNYGGKQVVTTRFRTTSAKGDGASRAQRDTRMLMPNLTLIGSQLREWLPVLWENNKLYKRPYTHFISHNMQRDLPLMPKQLIDEKRCCWGNLQVSCGTLPTIVYNITASDDLVTDVNIDYTASLLSASFGAFSNSLLARNPSFSEGDSIVFVAATYHESSFSGAPAVPIYTTAAVSALTLNVGSTLSVRQAFKGPAVNLYGFSSSFGSNLGILNAGSCSWGMIHVRKVKGRYLSSSQTMTDSFAFSDEVDLMLQPDYIDFCANSWGFRDHVL